MSVERVPVPPQSPSVVVCITDTAEERARLASMFDGVGVLVLADNAASASHFLGTLGDRSGREPIQLGRLSVDLTQFAASWANRPLPLTTHELIVLGSLASHPGRVWTYRQLHDEAWERTFFTGPAAVQSVVKRLRRKLRSAGASLEIEAVRGLGFRIAPE